MQTELAAAGLIDEISDAHVCSYLSTDGVSQRDRPVGVGMPSMFSVTLICAYLMPWW